MGDLIGGLAIMVLLSIAVFAIACRMAEGHRWLGNGLAIATVLVTFAYIEFAWDNIRLAELLPWSNLIIVGNWFLIASGFLAGVVWRRINHWRRIFPVAALFMAAGYATLFPMLGTPPVCRENWTDNGICLQTTAATCTPACAATLLRYHRIDTTEAEMARLCLTRSKGTSWKGLYRALKLKTRGTNLRVKVLYGTAEDLLAELPGRPMILAVGLPHDVTDVDIRYLLKWNPGLEHSVLLLGQNRQGLLHIVDPDPLIREDAWRARDLDVLWRGKGIALVPRRGSS